MTLNGFAGCRIATLNEQNFFSMALSFQFLYEMVPCYFFVRVRERICSEQSGKLLTSGVAHFFELCWLRVNLVVEILRQETGQMIRESDCTSILRLGNNLMFEFLYDKKSYTSK